MKISRIQIMKEIKSYTRPQMFPIIVLIISAAFALPVSLISPKFFQILIAERFFVVVAGLLGVYLCRFLLDGVNLIFKNRLLNSFTLSLRNDIWQKYLKLPFSDYQKREVGDLKMRLIDDVERLGSFIYEQVVSYLFNFLMIFFSLYLVLKIDATMTLYCLIVLPFVFLFDHLIAEGTKTSNEAIRTESQKYYTSTHNSLQYWREIKLQNAEQTFIDRFSQFRERLAKLGLRSIRYWAYREIFNDFKANYLSKVLIYIIGAFFVLKGRISVGVLIMFSEYFSLLFDALNAVNEKNVSLRVNTPYYSRIFETLSLDIEEQSPKKETKISGEIEINGLHFGYNSEQQVLKDINLKINSGEHIAIIGGSGCGKTTLVKLILGLCRQRSGEILFDRTDIEKIPKDSLYCNIGIVMQDNYLFNMSIRENLCLAKAGATESEIVDALRDADIYDFVKALPNGLDTIIGERGIKLSGGQKQRLSIAQAIIKKPKILIFDEATSALDKDSERVIIKTLSRLSDCTVIIISHKPSTVMQAGKIAVMDSGEIVDFGTHKELVLRNRFYQNLALTHKQSEGREV